MNIGIVGGRDFQDYEKLRDFIFQNIKLEEIDYVVSGGSKGTDRLGERFAKEFNIPKMIFKPDWGLYGKKAGFIRNKNIIDNSNVIFAFWDGKSKGTKSSIDIANSQNKHIYKYEYIIERDPIDEVFHDVLDYFLN